jgi:hypothetical protein
MQRHGLKDSLVQSYTGLNQFLRANGAYFNNLVVHIKEGVSGYRNDSQMGRSMLNSSLNSKTNRIIFNHVHLMFDFTSRGFRGSRAGQ